MAYNYVNSRIILDRLLSNPLLSDLTLEDLISHTVDFLRIVGIPDFFEEKNEEFIVENNRVLLPKYFYEVNQIVDNNGTIDLATSTFHYDNTNNNSSDNGGNNSNNGGNTNPGTNGGSTTNTTVNPVNPITAATGVMGTITGTTTTATPATNNVTVASDNGRDISVTATENLDENQKTNSSEFLGDVAYNEGLGEMRRREEVDENQAVKELEKERIEIIED